MYILKNITVLNTKAEWYGVADKTRTYIAVKRANLRSYSSELKFFFNCMDNRWSICLNSIDVTHCTCEQIIINHTLVSWLGGW